MRLPVNNMKSYFIIKKKNIGILALIALIISGYMYFTRKKAPQKN